MLIDLLALAAGLVALVFAGDKLVDGAVALATKFNISPLIVGLTVVAFGTSAPELFISLQAAFGGQPGLAIGNVVGSNIANVLLVLGAPAMIASIEMHEQGVGRSIIAMVAMTLVFVLMLWSGEIGRLDGALLFALLVAFLVTQIVAARRGMAIAAEDVDGSDLRGRGIAVALALGIVGLPIGAQLTIWGASGLAERFGVSDAVIGLTVVAIGTSLPELITSLLAAIRRTNSVAIGNVVGSNIFNIAAIMGITGLAVPMAVPPRIAGVDVWILIAVTALLSALILMRVTLGRLGGAAMLAGFLAFIVTAY